MTIVGSSSSCDLPVLPEFAKPGEKGARFPALTPGALFVLLNDDQTDGPAEMHYNDFTFSRGGSLLKSRLRSQRRLQTSYPAQD